MGTKRLVVICVLASTSAVLFMPSVAAAAARSGVTFQGGLTKRSDKFVGRVFSQKPAQCANDRRVKLFKQAGRQQNRKRDRRVAVTHSFQLASGHYKWDAHKRVRPGGFYARVSRTPACQADTSKTVHISRQVDTKITDANVDQREHHVQFFYIGTGGVSPRHFRCARDHQPYERCSSLDGASYAHLSPGRHVFKVFAIDSKGKRDRTPAERVFRIHHR